MSDSAHEIFERVFSEEEKAGLRGEVFVNRELLGVDLAAADLRAAHFKCTLLERCDLRSADLRGTHFILCDFHRVDLTGAVFGETRFDGSTFVDTLGVDDRLRALIEGGGGTFLPSHASRR
jgi:uncharacterized protein YjbI with pentapeptide repeats